MCVASLITSEYDARYYGELSDSETLFSALHHNGFFLSFFSSKQASPYSEN